MKKRLILSNILITIFLLISILTTNSLADPFEAPVNIDIINPEMVDMGDSFNVTVNISQVDDFDASNFDVSFNPNLINVTDVNSGKIDNTDVPLSTWALIEPGHIRIIVNIPGVSGATGEGHIAKIQFETISAGTSYINLSNGVISNTTAQEIIAEWNNSSVDIQVIEEPKVTIDFSPINIFKIMISFENTGDLDISNLQWDVEMQPVLSSKINFSDNGSIDVLNIDEKKIVLTEQMGKGIDFIELKVKAVFDEYAFSKEVYGLKVGPVVILFKES